MQFAPVLVIVVDDPADGLAIAGLVFAVLGFLVGTLASGFSIYLAWRAVQIGKFAAQEAAKANEAATKARTAVATERRRSFELEVLRELVEALDVERSQVIEIATDPRQMQTYFGSRLDLLPAETLPLWREIGRLRRHEDVEKRIGATRTGSPDWVRASKSDGFRHHNVVSLALTGLLLQDVTSAIRSRVDALDE